MSDAPLPVDVEAELLLDGEVAVGAEVEDVLAGFELPQAARSIAGTVRVAAIVIIRGRL